jgi:hypothetical protein
MRCGVQADVSARTIRAMVRRVVAAGAAILVLGGCGLLHGPGQIQASLAGASPGVSVSTDGWCGANWTRILVIPPYWPSGEVDDVLGEPWPGYADTGQEMRDDVLVFACVDGTKVRSWETGVRTAVDLYSMDIVVITKGESAVSIEVREGRRYLVVSRR